MLVLAGIGDWITGALERDGAKVRTVIPEEGGLQFTESFSIGKGSTKADLAKKWIQYITSPEGQVKSANMAAYPRSEEHTSELQSLMRISYAVFCLKKNITK